MTRFAPDVVLFDLDGTLIHSEPGVRTAIRHALAGFGIEPTDDELAAFMGPPLSEVLPELFGITDPADIQRFFDLYCEIYFHGSELEFEVYPGLAELVRELDASGVILALATAKPQVSATRILAHAGLLSHFAFVAGSELDASRQEKSAVIDHAFANIEADGRSHRIVMVGDRDLDIRAARAHGIASIGVTWGYGSLDELERADAPSIARTAAELRDLLLA